MSETDHNGVKHDDTTIDNKHTWVIVQQQDFGIINKNYNWTTVQQQSFNKIMIDNNQNRLCDYLLINGSNKDIQILTVAYSKDQILGLLWNFMQRNLNLINIDIIFNKLINLEPRLVCLDLALLCCQKLSTFILLLNRGYVPDKNFVQAFINLVLNSISDNNNNIITNVNMSIY